MTMWTTEQAERGRRLAEQEARSNWDLGDLTLEVVPEGGGKVEEQCDSFGNEIGVSGLKLKDCRRAAMAWPRASRIDGIAWTLHRDLSADPNRVEILQGFALHCQDKGTRPTRPNLWKYTGKKPWSSETAPRVAGGPVTPSADDIAHAVAQDPRLAEQVMLNKGARQALGTAAERHYAGSKAETVHRRDQDPVVQQARETQSFADLLSMMDLFARKVADFLPSVGRVEVGDEQLRRALERVERATMSIRTLADTGLTDMDAGLEQLLREGA